MKEFIVNLIIGLVSGAVGSFLTLYFTELRPEIRYKDAAIKMLQTLELPGTFKKKFEQRGKWNPGRWFSSQPFFHPGRMKQSCVDIADEMERLIREEKQIEQPENLAGKEELIFYYCKRIDYQICKAEYRFKEMEGIRKWVKGLPEERLRKMNEVGWEFIESCQEQNKVAVHWANLVGKSRWMSENTENVENEIMEFIFDVYKAHCLDPEKLEWRG